MTIPSSFDGAIRVVFLGNDPWSVPPLAGLADAGGIDIALVVTNPPRAAGRGARLRPTAVSDAAQRLGLPVEETASTSDAGTLDRLRAIAPDVLIVVAYGELLRPAVLRVPRSGAVNVHLSLLPRWRGASPVQHAILAGDSVTGVTVMLMDEGLDTGPVLARAETAILPDEPAGDLGARLADLGALLLPTVVRDLTAGRAVPQPQSGPVTVAPKLGPAARLLVWDQPAGELVRRVRAFAPDPGASTMWRGTPFKVLRATASDDGEGPPGTIASADADGVVVVAGSGGVRLLEVAPSGRRHMSATEWARGARPLPGESFG